MEQKSCGFVVGAKVVLEGLKDQSVLNGRRAVVLPTKEGEDPARVSVRVLAVSSAAPGRGWERVVYEEREVRVRPACLKVCDDSSDEEASDGAEEVPKGRRGHCRANFEASAQVEEEEQGIT